MNALATMYKSITPEAISDLYQRSIDLKLEPKELIDPQIIKKLFL